jgi:hypothetical protein
MTSASNQLTLTHLSRTVDAILRELDLGARSHDRSSAYTDYVACQFCVLRPSTADVAVIQKHFEQLARRFGWLVPEPVIHVKSNTISVTFQRSNLISTSDARMPI